MFKSRQARNIIDSSIWKSIDSLQGLDQIDKKTIFTEIMIGLTDDITTFEDSLSVPEQSGPSIWDFLHWTAKVADDEDNPSLYTDALSVVSRGHPCANVCRKHLVENLSVLPPSNYTSMFMHSFDLHNMVNRQLGKKNFSLHQAKKMYNLDCESCVFGAYPNAGSMH